MKKKLIAIALLPLFLVVEALKVIITHLRLIVGLFMLYYGLHCFFGLDAAAILAIVLGVLLITKSVWHEV